MESEAKTTDDLLQELEETRRQLYEAHETIEAIRTGQVDALVVQSGEESRLYTLQTADHAYRVFIEKMSEGAVTLNRQGIIVYANSQFAALVGLPLSQVISLPFEAFVATEWQAFYQTIFSTCWKGDRKGEVELCHNNQCTPVQLSLTPLELTEGISLSIIVTDLSLQKQTQKQLEEKNRQLAQLNKTLEASNHDLQQFASVASHDLQEPLRKIQMFANLLKNKGEDKFGEEEARYLNKVLTSASRMKTLIIDVLNYSRLSANDGEFVTTDLNALFKELLEDFELMIEEKRASITHTELPTLEVNRGQIRQVFQNLISNALKFSKAARPPVIEITSKHLAQKSFESREQANGPFCLISIKDNGIGFDEKYIPSIFSLFERLHSKDQYEGTGIGLSITKKIVEKHHGLIHVKSQEGIGAEFQILLPVKYQQL
jgi:PAS domain S-box-containing protein